jgi:hypothetical protein
MRGQCRIGAQPRFLVGGRSVSFFLRSEFKKLKQHTTNCDQRQSCAISQAKLAGRKLQKSCFWVVRMEVNTTRIRYFYVQQVRYGLLLHVETIPIWVVCLYLEFFSSKKVPRNRIFEKLLFSILKHPKIKSGTTKNALFTSVILHDRLVVEPFYETV